ncbi:MAG: CRISPR-associated endonuclease Cas2, partial [Fimbriimonadaceae bacterium]
MWVMVMFDLPTQTKVERRIYTQFRNQLIKQGFVMLQFSIYARACATWEAADKHAAAVEAVLPSGGEVRILQLTAAQFARMKRCQVH